MKKMYVKASNKAYSSTVDYAIDRAVEIIRNTAEDDFNALFGDMYDKNFISYDIWYSTYPISQQNQKYDYDTEIDVSVSIIDKLKMSSIDNGTYIFEVDSGKQKMLCDFGNHQIIDLSDGVNSSIKADEEFDDEGEYNDDPEIVFYVDGDLKYRGKFGLDFTNTLIDLCRQNKQLCMKIGDACNSLGDESLIPDIEDPEDVGNIAAELLIDDYFDNPYDFYELFDYGEVKGPDIECFLAKDLAD